MCVIWCCIHSDSQSTDTSEDWSFDVPEYVFKARLRVDPVKQTSIKVGVLFIMFLKILENIFAYCTSVMNRDVPMQEQLVRDMLNGHNDNEMLNKVGYHRRLNGVDNGHWYLFELDDLVQC
jgi:hypothetical protein